MASGDIWRHIVSHLDTNVLVHDLGGSLALMIPLWAVVVPVIPRGALPVYHLQGLEVSGGGGRRERFRGWLEEGCITSDTKDKEVNGDIDRKMIMWRKKTTFTGKWDRLNVPAGETVRNKHCLPCCQHKKRSVCICTHHSLVSILVVITGARG